MAAFRLSQIQIYISRVVVEIDEWEDVFRCDGLSPIPDWSQATGTSYLFGAKSDYYPYYKRLDSSGNQVLSAHAHLPEVEMRIA